MHAVGVTVYTGGQSTLAAIRRPFAPPVASKTARLTKEGGTSAR